MRNDQSGVMPIMIHPRHVFEIPKTGERFTFTKRPSDTNGELLEIEFLVKEFSPPAHIHVDLEERVEVLEGCARVRVGRKEWTAASGETVVFPAGKAHGFRAEGEEMLRFRCEIRPPRQMESLFETIFGLYRDGKADKRGQPNPLQNVVLAHEQRRTWPIRPSGFRSRLSPRSDLSPAASGTALDTKNTAISVSPLPFDRSRPTMMLTSR